MMRTLASAVVLLACTSSALAESAPFATTLLRNASVYTMDAARTRAQAIALDDEFILAVGDDATLQAYIGPNTQVVDLHGGFVLPGFIDAHVHLVSGGMAMAGCDLSEQRSVDAIVAKVRTCLADKPEGWLEGSGWDLSLFPAGNPSKTLLDAISSTRPIYLQGADGHSAWVNSAAFRAAGIDASTVDPPRGVIERDERGEPSGTLRESANSLVEKLIPQADAATRGQGLARATALASSYGITSAIEAAASNEITDTYLAAAEQGVLPMQVDVSLRYQPEHHDAVLARLALGPADGQVRVRAAKIFVDGVLEGETAALLSPYLDRHPPHSGSTQIDRAQLERAVQALDAVGVQVHMHAIGDAAARMALDAVARAREMNGARDNRHHIAHLQLVHPDDYPRFATLRVTANFQALWAFPDGYIRDINTPQVGEDRVQRMYPIGSLRRANARVVGGSDWSVSSMNPLLAIEVGVTRRDPSGAGTDVLNSNEASTLDDMLASYTIAGAWLMHRETELGSIEVGKRANFVVLARDLFAIPATEIGEVETLSTWFGGRVVFERGK